MGKTVTEERKPSSTPDEQQEAPTGERLGPPPSQKRSLLPFVIIASATIAGGVAIYWWMYLRGIVSTDDAQVEGHVHEISPRVAGTILKVFVDDNQLVKAGHVLVKLDPADYEVSVVMRKAELEAARAVAASAKTNVEVTKENTLSNLDQAKSMVAVAQANLDSTNKQVEEAQATLVAAEAKVRAGEASYDKASKDLYRAKTLVKGQAVAQQELDDASAAYDIAKANLEVACTSLTEVRATLAVKLAQVAQAIAGIQYTQARLRAAATGPLQVATAQDQANQSNASVQQAEAALAQAELNLSYTNIVSPVDGLVSKKTAESGAHVVAGQPFMAIVPLQDTWVVANFKETQISHMKAGQKVVITVDAYPGRAFHGVVDSIAAGTGARFSLLPPENATGNFVKVVQRIPVKVRIERSADALDMPALRPGMNVVATVDVREH